MPKSFLRRVVERVPLENASMEHRAEVPKLADQTCRIGYAQLDLDLEIGADAEASRQYSLASDRGSREGQKAARCGVICPPEPRLACAGNEEGCQSGETAIIITPLPHRKARLS